MLSQKMDNKDFVALVVLFVLAFYLWTLPIQKNPLPFGENDAAWHFANGDFMSTKDHSMGIKGLPNYISFWYYGFNKIIGPNALEYPPPTHINYAIMQLFGGERFVPVSIFKAITSFLGVFSVYFLVRKLYGFVAASLAGFGMVFSLRDYMTYLWGQQPSIISFVLIPILLYSVYAYFENRKPIYLYMATLLLASQYLLHLQGPIASLVILSVFIFLLFLKHKLELIKTLRKDLKHVLICTILFALISLPFISIYTGALESVGTYSNLGLGRLFQWTLTPDTVQGAYPPDYVLFFSQYRLFFLPFIFIGLFYLILRRDDKAILMLSWLLGIYILLHLDVFLKASSGRVARMLVCEPQMIFSLAAIGVVALPSFFKMPKNYKLILKYALAFIFIILLIFTLGKEAYLTLNNSYTGLYRTTQPQFQAAEWARLNLPEDTIVFIIGMPPVMPYGVISYPKARWYLALSQRHFGSLSNDNVLSDVYSRFKGFGLQYYFMFDYTDMIAIGLTEQINGLKLVEQKNFGNKTPIYNQNNIRVYRINEGQNIIR